MREIFLLNILFNHEMPSFRKKFFKLDSKDEVKRKVEEISNLLCKIKYRL